MSREIFDKSYPFLKKLEPAELKQLLMFIMMSLMEMSLGIERTDSKIEKFLKDTKEILDT